VVVMDLELRYVLDLMKILDDNRTIADGAVRIMYGFNRGYYSKMFNAF